MPIVCYYAAKIMPVTFSAKKKLRADARKESINQKVKSRVKLTLKNFKAGPTKETLREAYSVLDVAAKKRVIPKQRANRKKGRLAILLSKKGGLKPESQRKGQRRGQPKQNRSSQNR